MLVQTEIFLMGLISTMSLSWHSTAFESWPWLHWTFLQVSPLGQSQFKLDFLLQLRWKL